MKTHSTTPMRANRLSVFFFFLPALGLLSFRAAAQTAEPVPELSALVRAIPALLKKYGIPGEALSISKDAHLVYARGFGIADKQTGEPVQPDSLFRIDSVSKPLSSSGEKTD